MPMFWGDYLRDTGHLTAAEHGAYLMLIAHYWTTGKPLPADAEKLRRIARMTPSEWRASRATLGEFFHEEGGQWTHKRILSELVRAAERYARRALGARKTNAQRDAQRSGERDAVPDAEGTLRAGASQPQPHRGSNEPLTPVAPRGASDAFERFWSAYPHRGDKSDPKKPARAKFDKAVRDGVDPELIVRAAERYRAVSAGGDPQFNAQAATWLAQERWDQYAAAAVGVPSVPDEPTKWRLRVGSFRKSGLWLPEWGAGPDSPDCEARSHCPELFEETAA